MPVISPLAAGVNASLRRRRSGAVSTRPRRGGATVPPPDTSRSPQCHRFPAKRTAIDAKDLVDRERGPELREVVDGRRQRAAVRRQEHGVNGAGRHAGDDSQPQIGIAARDPAKQPYLVRRPCAAAVQNDGEIVLPRKRRDGGRRARPECVRCDVLQKLPPSSGDGCCWNAGTARRGDLGERLTDRYANYHERSETHGLCSIMIGRR